MKNPLQKIDLHARLKKHAYEHALITTYSFGATFFEDYALEMFKAFQNNGNISVLIDAGEYQELLDAIADKPQSFPKQANLRYLLHPIRVPGVFHPKVFLLAGKARGLLIIGSANFTASGLGSSAELVAAFDFEEGKEENTLPLFQAALAFFDQIADRWPSTQLESNINTLKAEAPWISKLPNKPSEDVPIFLSNLDRPLWDQLVERLPSPAGHVSILSPFFDAEPSLLNHVSKTSGISQFSVYTQNGITTLNPAWLETAEFRNAHLHIYLCHYSDEDHQQNLHAKAYAFDCGRQAVFAFGSANFTTPALRRTSRDGNLEVLLYYPPIRTQDGKPRTWFDPEATAKELKKASQLITATQNTDERPFCSPPFVVRVTEAVIQDDALYLKTRDVVDRAAICMIMQTNSRPFSLDIKRIGDGTFCASIDDTAQKRLRGSPAVVQLGIQTAKEWAPLSNQILITNLQDIETGEELTRQRQLREARESPQRFMDILTALSKSDDEERLKRFLTYCDIPMDLPVRLFKQRRGSVDFSIEMLRPLGIRNLRHFEFLHDAVIHFVSRHRRRLDQHIERGTAKGIPNFLHILLTVAKLLISQIERVIAGLNVEKTVEMDPERWYQIRTNLEVYYLELEGLLRLTAVNYVGAMLKIAAPDKIRDAFGDYLHDLLEIYERAIKDREVLDSLQRSHLEIVSYARRGIGPGFFNSLLAPESWIRFLERIRSLQTTLAERLAV